MSNKYWDDLEDMCIILAFSKHQQSIKYKHDMKDWRKHAEMLVVTKEFHNQFRMNPDKFEYLFDALEDTITVSCVKSKASKPDGNNPVYPEAVMACGLRFLTLGDLP